jgi:hypothetical protein
MIAYVGDTTARELVKRLKEAGLRSMLVRGRLSRRRLDDWAYDNGGFEDWRNERPFDADQFNADVDAMCAYREEIQPDFIVLPDKVAQGDASLDYSLEWLHELHERGVRLPCYLAVQDGMEPERTRPCLDGIAGLFVGGTLDWKLARAQDWVHLAHERGIPCHVGRVGSYKRVVWSKLIGADSIDSCLPLWCRAQERRFIHALRQQVLFEAGKPAKNL